MTHYFFDCVETKQITISETAEYFCLYAIIDSLYYWKVEWYKNTSQQSATIHAITSGFISAEIIEKYKNLRTITPAELRERFGTFSYFIERAVNGFKSYIVWISPDPQTTNIPWKIPVS